MKLKTILLPFIAVFFAAIASVSAVAEELDAGFPAPFGLEWGLTQEQVKALGVTLTEDGSDGFLTFYRTNSLPKNLSNADEYALLISPRHGLVKVVYASNTITKDAYGTSGKQHYEEIKRKLAAKYGTPESYEYSGRELYNEADEFYQCLLYDGCGSWVSFWEMKKSGLLSHITLRLEGKRRGQGWIRIDYESTLANLVANERDAEQSKKDDDAL